MRRDRALTPYEYQAEESSALVTRIFFPLLALLGVAGLFTTFTLALEETSPTLFLAGSCAMLIGLAVLVRLEYGVMLWILAGPLATIPLVRIAGGALYPSMILLAGLMGAWFLRMLLTQSNQIPRTSFNAPFIMLCAWMLIAVLAGNVFWDPFVRTAHRYLSVQLFCAGMVFMALGTIWMVGHYMATERNLRFFFVAIVTIGLFSLVLRYLAPMAGLPLEYRIYFDPMVRCHGAAMACAYAFVAPRKKTRMWMAGIASLCVLSVFLEFFNRDQSGGQWISGWVALCLPIAVVILFRSRAMFTAMALVSAMFLVAASPFIYTMIEVTHEDNNWFRLVIWERAFELPFKHSHIAGFFPGVIFGVGPGNWWDYHDSKYGTTGLSSAHGQYQQIVAEAGYVGFLLTIVTFFAIIAYLFRLQRQLKHPLHSSIALGALGSFMGMALSSIMGDYLFPVYHNAGYSYFSTTILTWVAIGGAVAADQYHSRDARLARGERLSPFDSKPEEQERALETR